MGRQLRLLSFGEIIWDRLPSGATLGGAPLNLAAHMSLLGAESYILSAVGNDSEGRLAEELIKGYGIRTDYLEKLSEYPTGSCNVTLRDGTPEYTLATDCAYDYIGKPTLQGDFDCLAFGTLAQRKEKSANTLKEIIANESFGEIYCDLNIRLPHSTPEAVRLCLENATIVKISLEELDFVTESALAMRLPTERAVRSLAEKYPKIKLLILTMGEGGSMCYDKIAEKLYTAAAIPCKVVSTVGAGDSFGATFLWKYFHGGSIQDCLRLASEISSYVVSCDGAIPEGMREYIKALPQGIL